MPARDILAAYATHFKDRTDEQKQVIREYRAQFARGRKFRLLTDVRLWGMQPVVGGQMGWGTTLPAGTVLTCAGESMTFGDGVPAIKWLDADGKHIANDCCVVTEQTVGGMWGGQVPRPGLMEAIDG